MTTFEHELEVRFRDCDGLGHVNNAVYLTYLEQARFAFWQRLTGVSGIPRSFILARVECDYRVQATAGDRLVVRLRVTAVGKSSFTFEYEIVNARTREVVATARTVQVMYDYQAGRSIPVPDDIRARLEA
ncbi:MAG TPA: thioesterase family protein [Vicinamibacterales bacterium]|jgi:acyl-CoA thioester hydrolase|nr:thioesterase family protein [Vicinamibacterales bacterium]